MSHLACLLSTGANVLLSGRATPENGRLCWLMRTIVIVAASGDLDQRVLRAGSAKRHWEVHNRHAEQAGVTASLEVLARRLLPGSDHSECGARQTVPSGSDGRLRLGGNRECGMPATGDRWRRLGPRLCSLGSEHRGPLTASRLQSGRVLLRCWSPRSPSPVP